MSSNHSTKAFSHREPGSGSGKQSLTHLKPWFSQSEETLVSLKLGEGKFCTQLRLHENPHGAKMVKSKPKVLTNSRYCWGGKEGTSQTNFHQQQKEQDQL